MNSIFTKPGGGLTGTPVRLDGYLLKTSTFGEGDKAYTKINMEVTLTKDGGTEPTTRFLDGGFLREGQSISKDGQELLGGNRGIEADTEVADFIMSAVNAQPALADSLTDRNFTVLTGARVVLNEVVNTERQMAAGKKALGRAAATASVDDIMKAGRRKDRNDPKKSYNHTKLLIETVLELNTPGVTGAPKASSKRVSGAPTGKPAAVTTVDAAFAKSFITEAVQKQSPLTVGELDKLALQEAVRLNLPATQRAALRTFVKDEGVLASEDGWAYADGSVLAVEVTA